MILLGTGSEVQIAVAARERLEADGVPTRVVSRAVLRVVRRAGPGLQGRGAAAVGARPGQRRGRRCPWAGASSSATPAGSSASTHYGASAAYTVLYEKFGLTDEAVVAAARESIAAAASGDAVPAGPVAATGGLAHPTGDR